MWFRGSGATSLRSKRTETSRVRARLSKRAPQQRRTMAIACHRPAALLPSCGFQERLACAHVASLASSAQLDCLTTWLVAVGDPPA